MEASAHLAGFLMESWVVGVIGLLGGGLVAVVIHSIWIGRHVVTREDLDGIRELITAETRLVGEALAGIRQKVTDVELDIAKNYVRRDSWHQAMNQLQTQFASAEKAAEEWRLRMEQKFDRLWERMAGE